MFRKREAGANVDLRRRDGLYINYLGSGVTWTLSPVIVLVIFTLMVTVLVPMILVVVLHLIPR